jgi:translation initiation factor RLI1
MLRTQVSENSGGSLQSMPSISAVSMDGEISTPKSPSSSLTDELSKRLALAERVRDFLRAGPLDEQGTNIM